MGSAVTPVSGKDIKPVHEPLHTSPSSLRELLEDGLVQLGLREQLLQPRDLRLQLLEPPGLVRAHRTVLVATPEVGGLGDRQSWSASAADVPCPTIRSVSQLAHDLPRGVLRSLHLVLLQAHTGIVERTPARAPNQEFTSGVAGAHLEYVVLANPGKVVAMAEDVLQPNHSSGSRRSMPDCARGVSEGRHINRRSWGRLAVTDRHDAQKVTADSELFGDGWFGDNNITEE